MSNVATIPQSQVANSDIIENVLVKGDLSRLTPQERTQYYLKVCESVGLNPLTKPMEYITLNGKMVLYALRACTDQLRAIHNVSVVSLDESEREGVFIVTAKMQNGLGRTDMAKGAVTITGLKGDNLANALMKAETKAKRRATLSLCGLGMLDETEIETIPTAVTRPQTLPKKDAKPAYTRMQSELDGMSSRAELDAWGKRNAERIAILPEDWQDWLRLRWRERALDLQQQEPAAAKTAITSENFPSWLKWLDADLAAMTELADLDEYWNRDIAPLIEGQFPPDQQDAIDIYARHQARLSA